jgi:hypothetical protein
MAVMNESMDTVVVASSGAIHPHMNWGAIIAGWLVATAVSGLLYVAGLALGFAAFDPHDLSGVARGIGIGTAIWLILTWAAGLFIGGLFASWFDGKADETMGTMHGITVWGLSLAATALWLSLGLGHAMQHRAPMMRGGHAMGAAAADGNDALLVLQANVHRLTSHRPDDRAPRSAGDGAIVAAILANHRDTARALLLANDVPADAIDQTLPRLETEAGAANAQLKIDADRAAHYASMAMWVAFLTGLLALVTAALGGWMGAGNVHRVYHLRRYEGRPIVNSSDLGT